MDRDRLVAKVNELAAEARESGLVVEAFMLDSLALAINDTWPEAFSTMLDASTSVAESAAVHLNEGLQRHRRNRTEPR